MVAADSVFTNAALPRCRSAAHSNELTKMRRFLNI